MAEKTTSHVHNTDTAAKPEAPAMPDFFQMFPKMPELFRMPDFGKVPQVAEISAAWKKNMDEQFERMTSVHAEMTKAGHKGADQAALAIDEMARLTKASLQYSLTLTEQWRQMSLDAARRTADFVRPVN